MKQTTYRLASVGGLTILYFVAGKLGLTLAFLNPSATAVWPCSGIALSALLLLGYGAWPGVLLGAFFVNATTAGSLATSAGIAAGNTLEALAGAWLVNCWAQGAKAMSKTRDVFLFAILAGMLSTALAATIGVTSLSLAGFSAWENYLPVWLTWWMGDAVGDVVVGPLLLLWYSNPRLRWRWAYIVEYASLFACLIFVAQIVFNGALISGTEKYPLEYLCIPVLIWAAFRFGQREAATANLVLSAIAIWGTLHGLGPFVRQSSNESLLLLQAFLGVGAVTTMALAAEVAERKAAEKEARSLAVSDPLTGLGNYRKLIDSLEMEIKRSERSGRSFVFLLLDVDGLKKINDVHGHLVGSRVLRRLADVLRLYSRSVDVPARYGGDEFAIILPEQSVESARHVVRRISERLAHDSEQPVFSVSVGIAHWPVDGCTTEGLMRAADLDLYDKKRQAGRAASPHSL